MPPRQPVESSSIAEVAYSPAGQQLEIEFKTGSVYCYFEVPEDVYAELMQAESVGAYFNAHIRPRFGYARIQKPRPRRRG